MCGLVALIRPEGGLPAQALADMCGLIAHRGPDGEGFALFDGAGAWPAAREELAGRKGARVGFGHRRLAILDVTAAGHQPMRSADGGLWIVYNGEIYNHLELRAELESLGARFTTHSDTEVLLAAWRQWGQNCLPRLNGMFAFVLYDCASDTVTAVRDRLGVKPLYWWRAPDGTLAFASEIKAFTVLPGWAPRLNGQRAYDFLAWGITDHTEETMFAGVRQVPAGGIIHAPVGRLDRDPVAERWYTPRPAATIPASFGEACAAFHDLFLDSVRLRLRADVPVGTALSGGLDSSSIVCAVHRLLGQGGAGRNAFSSRSDDAAFDEGPFMEAVVRRTGVTHHNARPTAQGFLDELPDLVWHQDEPFGGASIYAQWRVFAKVAETNVKVTLDGHGADEILAGYTAYVGPQLGGLVRTLRLGRLADELIAQHRLQRRSLAWLLGMMADDLLPGSIRSTLRRLSGKTHSRPDWLDLDRLDANPHDPFETAGGRAQGILSFSLAQLSAVSLPMQLKWFDRDSMAFSIESREPFLDHRLMEFALALPDEWKLHKGLSKRVLREGLADILPPEIAARRDKMGFATAESLWVTRDRPEAYRQAAERAVARSGGILTPAALDQARAMTEGKQPFHTRLMRQIAFGAWMERFDLSA